MSENASTGFKNLGDPDIPSLRDPPRIGASTVTLSFTVLSMNMVLPISIANRAKKKNHSLLEKVFIAVRIVSLDGILNPPVPVF